VVAYLSLFRYADWLDALLMLLGGLAGITHGAALPVFFIFLGKLIDSLGALSLDPTRALREVNKVHRSTYSLHLLP
jgi:ATP-binding cassette subfamily B (MDR/TAP) protein 1